MLRKLRDRFHKKPDLEIEEIAPGNLKLKAGDVDVSVALPQPEFPMPEPLPPITLVSPACPYCGVLQEPAPTRRRKCRDCGEYIHPRSDRRERKRYLYTEAQATEWDWEHTDQKWRWRNQQKTTAMKTGDWSLLATASDAMALMLFHRGRDHRQLAEEAKRAELRQYQATEVSMADDARRVVSVVVKEIRIASDEYEQCPTCRVVKGRRLAVTDALQLMPLPVKGCTRFEEHNRYGGLCRCQYSPVFPPGYTPIDWLNASLHLEISTTPDGHLEIEQTVNE